MMKDELQQASSTPNLSVIHAEFKRSVDEQYRNRQQVAERTRYAYWDAQSPDGKKWDENMSEGKRAFPFNGSSDTRIRLADEIIQDRVDTLKAAFARAQFVAEGIGAEDAERAGITTKRLDWAKNTGINDLNREHELLEQYAETYGWAALQITWDRKLNKRTETMTMDELMMLSAQIQQVDPGNPAGDLASLINDEGSEEAAADLVRELYPGFVQRQSPEIFPQEINSLTKAEAVKIVKALRTTGQANFPVPYVSRNNPALFALKPFEEFFFPPESTDIQRARAVFRVDWLTEAELRGNIRTKGWNKEWVENVVEVAQGAHSPNIPLPLLREGNGETVYNLHGLDKQFLHEVVYAYTRGIKDGVECIYCTVFCPHYDVGPHESVGREHYAKHEMLNYAHGQYPFIVKVREAASRRVCDSRGVPELVSTWQNEIKSQRDSLVDRTSLSISPPLKVPLRNMSKAYRLAPMQQVGVTRPDEIEWMEPPPGNPREALEVIQNIKNDCDEYFGRTSELVPPAKSQVRQQNMVDADLAFWVQVFKQVDALMLQYMGEENLMRISGAPGGAGDFSEIQRQHDWKLRFDVRELDTEFMGKKLEYFTQFVLNADRAGVVDMAAVVELMANMVDPTIRRAVVTSPQAANQKMYERTLTDIIAMAQGNEVPYVESDPTAERQLQYAQQIIASNPKYQEQLQADERFGELMQKWMQNREQSVMQRQNSMIGRLGVAPSSAATY